MEIYRSRTGYIRLAAAEFFTSREVWRRLERSQISLDKILPDYRDGFDGVKYRLLNDINALMKYELLNYDWIIKKAEPQKPKIFSKSGSNLTETEHRLLDILAEVSSEDEPKLSMICAKHETYVQSENLWISESNV